MSDHTIYHLVFVALILFKAFPFSKTVCLMARTIEVYWITHKIYWLFVLFSFTCKIISHNFGSFLILLGEGIH